MKFVPGALLYRDDNFLVRWLMKRIVGAAGGDTDTSRNCDYTDWNDVQEFALAFGRRVGVAA